MHNRFPPHEGQFDLDDYIDYVIDMLHVLGPGTHVMAVCQPSVPVLAAVALMSARKDKCVPASMTLMGGPIDTRRNPTVVNYPGGKTRYRVVQAQRHRQGAVSASRRHARCLSGLSSSSTVS